MPLFQSQTQRIIILGSTGSIGTQTLEVIDHLNALHARGEWGTRCQVVGLAARRNWKTLTVQQDRWRVEQLALTEASACVESDTHRSYRTNVFRTHTGDDAALKLVQSVECDLVVAAMSGSAGLAATLRAVELGRHVALANKETLVAAGELIVAAAQKSGARLLPIDSEHSSVWQCLASGPDAAPPMQLGPEVSRVILTASGGPFRTWPAGKVAAATPEQALNHPTWKMGPKVTIDSATLMNKALELIEAHWLFGLAPERLGVLIHPQSIVHAIVEFAGGSSLAQLGAPDMRAPIQHALTFPERAPACARRLAWDELRSLDFEFPDHARYPALPLAFRALREGGTAGAILNAANEAAVEAFLASRIPFGRITDLVAAAMDRIPVSPLRTLGDATDAAARARDHIQTAIAS